MFGGGRRAWANASGGADIGISTPAATETTDRTATRRRSGNPFPIRCRPGRNPGAYVIVDVGHRSPVPRPSFTTTLTGAPRESRRTERRRQPTEAADRRAMDPAPDSSSDSPARSTDLCALVAFVGEGASYIEGIVRSIAAILQRVRGLSAPHVDLLVERTTGFEPATPTLARWCSTN